MELPVITGENLRKVKEFYKQLRCNVQSLDTFERLGDVKGNVRSTIDKLKGVKADLVRGNEGWRDWNFKDLLRELKNGQTSILSRKARQKEPRLKEYQIQSKQCPCVY